MISVLFVDDDQTLCKVARTFLERTGEFRVGTAPSAQAALDSAGIRSCDAIVSDYQMAKVDGIALLKSVRERFGDIPFILFTGKGREEVVIEAINNGADFYIQKGGDPQAQFAELAHKIRQAVRRRQAEREKAQSEEKFLRLFMANPSLEAITDLSTGKIIEVNEAFVALTGYTREEIIGKTTRELDLFMDYGVREQMERALHEGGTVRHVEGEIRTKAGEVRTLDFFAQRLQIGADDILFSQAIDITDRKRAEEAIRKSREQFATAMDLARLVNWEYDVATGMFTFDDRFYSLYGTSAGREGGTRMSAETYAREFLHPDDQHLVAVETEKALRTTDPGYVSILEHRIVRRDGEVRHIVVRIAVTKDADGKTIKTHGANQDITDFRRAENARLESEKIFRTIFENSPYPIGITSAQNYRFLAVNRSFIEVSGFFEAELIGKTHLELGLISLAESAKLIARYMAAGSRLENVPLALTGKDGARIHVLFSAIPITFSNEPAILTMTVEVTKLRRVEEELIRKNDELNSAFKQLCAAQEELKQKYHELEASDQAVRESEAQFRALVENALDGILITDFSGNLLFVNRAAGSIVDVENYRAIAGKRNVMEFVAPDSREDVLADFTKVASGIDAYLAVYHLITETKRDVWIESIGRRIPFRGEDAILVSIRDVTTRRQAELALRESEEKFSKVFRKSPVALSLVSAADGVFVDVNEAFEKNTGYSRDEVIGKTSGEIGLFKSALDRDRMIALFLSQRVIHGLEVPFRIRSGETRTCLFSSSLIHMGGRPHILTTIEDISDRKAAEVKLFESESKYRRLAQNAPDMIYRMELPGMTYEYISPASVALTGYTPEEFYAEPGLTKKLIHPAWRDYFRTQWKALLNKNVPPVYEFQIIDRAGKIRWLNQRNMLVTGESGEPVAIEGIVTDITRQKETESELRRQNQRSLAVSENAGSWIWEVDRSGLYRYSSPAVEKILGYRPDEIVGKKFFYDFFDPDMQDELREMTLAAFAKHEPFHNFENLNTHKNGTHVILNTSGTPLFDDNGNLTGYCGVDEDITARRKSEEALRRTNHQLNLLAGITRHDILNRITVMLGYLTIAQKRCGDPGVDEYLKKMFAVIEMIRSQIEFTRVYQTLGTHEPQWLVLEEVIPHANIPITITLIEDVKGFTVYADAMLEKVFFNLLDNSVRHGQRVTQIRVTARVVDRRDLVIIWEDNGVGVDADDKEQIFERGFGKNTGLGLFLVREILTLTGITIAETGTPGKGARFEITVPKGSFRIIQNP